jgi:glycosyltransferase involved in cell wall biosynthesis
VSPTPFGGEGLFGGGERYPLELARALARLTDCELVTFGRHPCVVREPGGLVVRVVRAVGHVGGHPVHPLAPGLPLALRRADVVHVHHPGSVPGQVAVVAGRVFGRVVVATDHGLGRGGLVGLFPSLVHHELPVSQFSAQRLRTPPDRTTVIYGGADTDRFVPDPGEARTGVLFVGRFTPHKGLDRLLQALPENAALTCVGTAGHDPEPPERDYPWLLKRLAAGRDVTFLGGVADSVLPTLYRRARVVVLPSVYRTCYGKTVAISELLGLSVLEAMASGTPVICSRIGGLPEVVQDGVTGYLVEPGDVDGLRDRLGTVLGDPVAAGRMGQAARAAVVERFTWASCAERCLAVYRGLTGLWR